MTPTVIILMNSRKPSSFWRRMLAVMIVAMITTTAVDATICACSTSPRLKVNERRRWKILFMERNGTESSLIPSCADGIFPKYFIRSSAAIRGNGAFCLRSLQGAFQHRWASSDSRLRRVFFRFGSTHLGQARLKK
jgi:hypothetical protein